MKRASGWQRNIHHEAGNRKIGDEGEYGSEQHKRSKPAPRKSSQACDNLERDDTSDPPGHRGHADILAAKEHQLCSKVAATITNESDEK